LHPVLFTEEHFELDGGRQKELIEQGPSTTTRIRNVM
jgi:hypothetical protein